jgi:hypothetical protein
MGWFIQRKLTHFSEIIQTFLKIFLLHDFKSLQTNRYFWQEILFRVFFWYIKIKFWISNVLVRKIQSLDERSSEAIFCGLLLLLYTTSLDSCTFRILINHKLLVQCSTFMYQVLHKIFWFWKINYKCILVL